MTEADERRAELERDAIGFREALILGYLFVKSAIDLSDAENSYSGQAILGMGVPFVIGMGFLLLGFVLLVVWRFLGHERFFGRRPFEAVDPAIAGGTH